MVGQTNWLLLYGLLTFTSLIKSTKTRHTSILNSESFVDQCTPVPTWAIGRGQAVGLIGPNITVIALLNSSRLHGREQAAKLNSLRSRLYQAGFPAINFMVINSMLATENTELLRNEAANIPVYQEQPAKPVKDILGVSNDHILVLDRCGRMAYQVITPFSELTYPYVKAAILSTYKDNLCGLCNATKHKVELQSAELVGTTLLYISDAPNQADDKFINLQNESIDEPQEDITSFELPENQLYNQTHSQTFRPFQRRSPHKGNELIQLFSQNQNGVAKIQSSNASAQDTQKIGNKNASLIGLLNVTVESAPQTSLTNRYSGNYYFPEVQANETAVDQNDQENRILQINYSNSDGGLKNWNWSERTKDQGIHEVSGEGENQSVEIVRHTSYSKRQKKKKKSNEAKEREENSPVDPNTLFNQTRQCKIFQYCSEKSSSTSTEGITVLPYTADITNSMEGLINDTQKLFDWYQKKTEQYVMSAERSNVLKRKLIEHYSKLLPWLNFTLVPEIEN